MTMVDPVTGWFEMEQLYGPPALMSSNIDIDIAIVITPINIHILNYKTT